MNKNKKQEGYVKWYSIERGIGFTTNNIFIHYKELNDGAFTELKEGDCIQFDLIYTSKDKPKATNIDKVKKIS